MSATDRLSVLARFIRGQANLTEGHPHKPGPGEVKLNHEEALLCADALEQAGLQREFARHLASGLTVEQTGTRMGISRNTRKGYLSRVATKAGLPPRSGAEAVAAWARERCAQAQARLLHAQGDRRAARHPSRHRQRAPGESAREPWGREHRGAVPQGAAADGLHMPLIRCPRCEFHVQVILPAIVCSKCRSLMRNKAPRLLTTAEKVFLAHDTAARGTGGGTR